MAKIIVTLDRLEKHPWGAYLPEILETGSVDVFRINVVRWSEEQIRGVLGVIRSNKPSPKILFDLGQKLRIYFPQQTIRVSAGKTLQVFLRPSGDRMSFNYDVSDYVFSTGQVVLINDAKVRGEVVACSSGGHIIIRITQVEERNSNVDQLPGVMFPGMHIRPFFFGPKEKRALELAHELSADMVATSFTEKGEDIRQLMGILPSSYQPVIVAKVETEKGVEGLGDIVSALPQGKGMVMVARGDLYVGISPAQLGLYQRRIIQACKSHSIPFIISTGILSTMRWERTPTRAEVADADAAVQSGASHVMLCEETAKDSLYPIEAIQILHQVCQLAE